jgi:hypothetical protein
MRKSKVLIIGFLAAAMTILPLSASATAPSPQPITVAESPGVQQTYLWPGECRHAWTKFTEIALVYAQPNDNARIVTHIPKGAYSACRSLALGGRYADCGGTNANGWILVPLSPAPYQGWVHSTCTKDPDPLPPI